MKTKQVEANQQGEREIVMNSTDHSDSEILIAIAGNPNSGKTSIFNQLTGATQKVGNYPGVTVEKIVGHYVYEGKTYQVVDLPGVYSMSAYSPEEHLTREFLSQSKPNVVINVIDASNLERNLCFTVQLLELGLPVIIALNMSDELRKMGKELNIACLADKLHIPIIPTVGHKGQGITELKKTIAAHSSVWKSYRLKISYHPEVEEGLERLAQALQGLSLSYPVRYVALQLLEADPFVHDTIQKQDVNSTIMPLVREITRHIREVCGDLPDVVISDGRYGFSAGLIREATIKFPSIDRVNLSEKIDALATNRFLAFPIFLGLMYLLFWFVFQVGEIPMNWLEHGIQWLQAYVSQKFATENFLRSLIVDAVLGGAGGVIVFLPNILLLFMGIALLEDSGYMARAAFIMDGIMAKIGLQGKSFIPMLIGFGCTVPGIMATRILDNEKDRLATMFILPLMSCGARFTIYALIIPAFFPSQWQALVLWCLYIFGIVLGACIAKLLRLTILKGEAAPFVMELPPYRLPTWKGILHHMWQRSWSYLKKAATVILLISIAIWFCSYFPQKKAFIVDQRIAAGELISAEQVNALRAKEQLEYSALGRLGKLLEPIVAPMGFDGRLATALIGSFAAKEVFVAQLGVIFSIGETDIHGRNLREKLRSDYSPLVGVCILIFCLIATPCMATVAVMYKESCSWSLTMLQFWGFTAFAYCLATLVYQIGSCF